MASEGGSANRSVEARLLWAQGQAEQLFTLIERDLVRPGVDEVTLGHEVKLLAHQQLGVDRHWHKRIVRSGSNTLLPYRENPPNRVLEEDDIVFFDLGPVFAEWEADVGRTYVLGDDPAKIALRDSLEPAWQAGHKWFGEHPEATGAELYGWACAEAARRGYDFGGGIAGHLVGEFPHERLADDRRQYIAPGNDQPMNALDAHGNARHWILEVHFVDRERQIGGFLERLLTLP